MLEKDTDIVDQRTVFRYKIPTDNLDNFGGFTLNLPKQFKVLHIDEDGGVLYMWILIQHDAAPHIKKLFYAKGTGHRFCKNEESFLGTVKIIGNYTTFYWHIFGSFSDTPAYREEEID